MVSFVHIYREANAYANAMAKMSLSLESDTIVYNTYLKDIVQLISSDTIGTSFLCIVFSQFFVGLNPSFALKNHKLVTFVLNYES